MDIQFYPSKQLETQLGTCCPGPYDEDQWNKRPTDTSPTCKNDVRGPASEYKVRMQAGFGAVGHVG